MPPTIALVISNGLASLRELDTVYGMEDLHDMLEIAIVNSQNRAILNKPSGT